jgi:hypothetical protein
MASMPRHIWTVLCERVLIDPETNSLTLVDVVEQLTLTPDDWPPQPSVLSVRLELVSLWFRETGDSDANIIARTVFETPAKKVLAQGAIEIGFPRDAELARTTARFRDLPVEGAGTYLFRIERQRDADAWEEVTRVPLRIVFERSDAVTA